MSNRINWPQIKAHIDNDTNNLTIHSQVICFIPDGFRRIIMGLEFLEWEATYRTVGYDYSDYDELQSVIHKGQNGLMEYTPVFLLIEKLEEIRAETEGIKDAITGIAIPDTSTHLEGIVDILGLLDPRIAILQSILDSIEDVMGGTYTPPPPPP